MAGQRWLGRYRLEEPLGRGSMGEVWRAHDELLDRTVAVKLLPADIELASVDGERLLREAHALAQIEHPNVVAVYDVDRAQGRPFLVMEALDGRTLADELAESGRLTADEVRAVWQQVSAGLAAAHAAGVMHRDIKPGNLMRTVDGTVKVVDFGLADDGWGGGAPTRSGAFLGTAAYAAPERLLGWKGDAQADLYSLGCVLYELLTGQPPFTGDLLAQTYAHVHAHPVPVSRLRPDVPADLEALVMSLLQKSPAARKAPVKVPPQGRRKSLVLAASAGAGLFAAGVVAAVVLLPMSVGGPTALDDPRPVPGTQSTRPLPPLSSRIEVEHVAEPSELDYRIASTRTRVEPDRPRQTPATTRSERRGTSRSASGGGSRGGNSGGLLDAFGTGSRLLCVDLGGGMPSVCPTGIR